MTHYASTLPHRLQEQMRNEGQSKYTKLFTISSFHFLYLDYVPSVWYSPFTTLETTNTTTTTEL